MDQRAALDNTRVDLGVAFVGVPVTRVLTLRNMTMLPAAFRWSAAPEGEDEDSDGAMRFSCDCPSGELAPAFGARAVQVRLHAHEAPPMGAKKKSYAALVACDVEGARAPWGSAQKEIRGLEGSWRSTCAVARTARWWRLPARRRGVAAQSRAGHARRTNAGR